MSDGDNHHPGKNEIIIVKRHKGGHDDGAHGGAWKIAYADFMTAMMAFFLVMWLVNAANEETKASMASYFNPIKLSDETPAEKGLKKPVDKAEGREESERSKVKGQGDVVGSAAATGDDMTSTSGDQQNYSEADFFENPYSVLAEIAQEVGQQANVSAKGEGGTSDSGPATGAEGGEAYRDPFDPDFWTKQIEATRAEGPSEAVKVDPQQDLSTEPKEQPATVELAVNKSASAEDDDPAQQTPADSAQAGNAYFSKTADAGEEAKKLQEQLEKQLSGVAGKLAEGLVVTPAEGGMLITISDQMEDPMFNVGSAVPRKDMVLAMEKVGQVLKDKKGDIVVRGHTDGRQFKGDGNDNWRLSMARAHSAYYMLVHGGVQDGRIKQVSGFADRRLQVPSDPLSPGNRRIEILLQAGES